MLPQRRVVVATTVFAAFRTRVTLADDPMDKEDSARSMPKMMTKNRNG
jgi:hypothetical protein